MGRSTEARSRYCWWRVDCNLVKSETLTRSSCERVEAFQFEEGWLTPPRLIRTQKNRNASSSGGETSGGPNRPRTLQTCPSEGETRRHSSEISRRKITRLTLFYFRGWQGYMRVIHTWWKLPFSSVGRASSFTSSPLLKAPERHCFLDPPPPSQTDGSLTESPCTLREWEIPPRGNNPWRQSSKQHWNIKRKEKISPVCCEFWRT